MSPLTAVVAVSTCTWTTKQAIFSIDGGLVRSASQLHMQDPMSPKSQAITVLYSLPTRYNKWF